MTLLRRLSVLRPVALAALPAPLLALHPALASAADPPCDCEPLAQREVDPRPTASQIGVALDPTASTASVLVRLHERTALEVGGGLRATWPGVTLGNARLGVRHRVARLDRTDLVIMGRVGGEALRDTSLPADTVFAGHRTLRGAAGIAVEHWVAPGLSLRAEADLLELDLHQFSGTASDTWGDQASRETRSTPFVRVALQLYPGAMASPGSDLAARGSERGRWFVGARADSQDGLGPSIRRKISDRVALEGHLTVRGGANSQGTSRSWLAVAGQVGARGTVAANARHELAVFGRVGRTATRTSDSEPHGTWRAESGIGLQRWLRRDLALTGELAFVSARLLDRYQAEDPLEKSVQVGLSPALELHLVPRRKARREDT